LGEETPEKPLASHSPPRPQPSIEISPPHIDESPSRPELESSPPPPHDFEVSPRRTPEVDPSQQEVYDYLESLEKTFAGPSTTLPHMTPDAQVQSLKQEVFELEVLNRHIKQENEALKEQSKVDKIIHDNIILHLGLWQKKKQETKEKVQKVEQRIDQSQIQVSDKETQNGGGTKEEEKRTRCPSRGFRTHGLKGND